ncbi:hypothetical protein D3C71_1036090 [compost metagenome]
MHLFIGVADVTGERGRIGEVVVRRVRRVAAAVERVVAAGCLGATRAALHAVELAPLAVGGPAIGRVAVGVAVTAEAAVTCPHGFFFRVFGGEGGREAVIGPAGNHVDAITGAVALAVLAVVDVRGDAVDVGAGDDVDHAGHRIGTIDGRGAVLQYFDAFDRRHGQGRHVLVARGADAQALAVDQHQRALGAQVAHVHVGTTCILTGRQHVGAADGRAAHRGHVLQDVRYRAETLALDVGAGQRQYRLRRFNVHLADTRTGDFDAVQVGRRGGAAALGERRQRSQRRGGCQGVADGLPQCGGA